MIDKTNIISTVEERLSSIPVGHCIDIRTYKRNRSVLFIKKGRDKIRIIEDGFYQEEFEINFNKLRKALKTLLKKEFPRSNKIRLYNMGKFDPRSFSKIQRKKI